LTNDSSAQGSLLPEEPEQGSSKKSLLPYVSRRQFLFMGAAAVSLIALERIIPGRVLYAQTASFDRERIASLSELEVGVPVSFSYPYEHPNTVNNLIKLGSPAGGGMGPENDVVAFNTICPHMGFPLTGAYKPDHQVMGPCGWHLTTFDLTRHGIVISGHATQGLPQITLELDGDDIYATGVQALIFGFSDNGKAPPAN
jgi:arsenite oxidase small subunit